MSRRGQRIIHTSVTEPEILEAIEADLPAHDPVNDPGRHVLPDLPKLPPRKKPSGAKTGRGKRTPSIYGSKDNRTTEKQERFARMVALEGMNYAEAYRQAYELSETIKPTTIYGDATRTAHLPNVMARINELLEMKDRENSVRALTRAARVIDTLEKIMDHGKTDASRIKAAELLGKTVGAFREERGNDDSGRSLEELEDRLERMLSKRAKRARTINNE